MNTRVKQAVIALAVASPAIEICGLIYAAMDGSTEVFPCANVAGDPATHFEIASDDLFTCMKRGEPIAIYHSHPVGPAAFSLDDLSSADENDLPLYLYDLSSQIWLEYIPANHTVDLEGRRFTWGFEDCYGTVRHYYRQELETPLYLGDYDRDETFERDSTNLILDNLEREGFVRLAATTSIQPHDILLFKLPHGLKHLGVFTGNQRMLHHPQNALSRIDLLDGRWLDHLDSILRHHSLA